MNSLTRPTLSAQETDCYINYCQQHSSAIQQKLDAANSGISLLPEETGLNLPLVISPTNRAWVILNPDTPLYRLSHKTGLFAERLLTKTPFVYEVINSEREVDSQYWKGIAQERGSLKIGADPNFFKVRNLWVSLKPLETARILSDIFNPNNIKQKRGVYQNLILTVEDLHTTGIIHRNIKPTAFLVQKICKEKLSIVLHDLSCACEPGKNQLAGTLFYLAPECARAYLGQQPLGPSITSAMDVFSLGVTFAQLFPEAQSLLPEHRNSPLEQIAENASYQEKPQPRNPESIEFTVWRMLRRDPRDRATLASLPRDILFSDLSPVPLGRVESLQDYSRESLEPTTDFSKVFTEDEEKLNNFSSNGVIEPMAERS